MGMRSVPRWLGAAKRAQSRCINVTQSRTFSGSIPRRANTLMETSGFSDTQLQVREAIGKICSNFPDVSGWAWQSCEHFIDYFVGILGPA